MNRYDQLVEAVMKHLESYVFDEEIRKYHKETYDEIREWLQSASLEPSRDNLQAWLDLKNKLDLDKKNARCRYLTVSKLIQLLDKGKIRTIKSEKRPIEGELKKKLDDFMEAQRNNINYSSTSLKDYKMYVSMFLRYLLSIGINSVNGLTYDVIDGFMNTNPPGIATPFVSAFILYLSNEKYCSEGVYWYLHYYKYGWMAHLSHLSKTELSKYKALSLQDPQMSFLRFSRISEGFLVGMKESGYKYAVLKNAERAMRILGIFLEMTHLSYTPALSDELFLSIKYELKRTSGMIGRAFQQFQQYYADGQKFDKESICHHQSSPIYPPEWAAETLDVFLAQEAKIGKGKKALQFYKNANIRFLCFLESQDIHSFRDITREHVQLFNITDGHETIYSKNAHACRIRKFLRYLRREGIVTINLESDLLHGASSPTKVVTVLTDEEEDELEQYCNSAQTPMEKRNAAILRLGLSMGFRGVDIAGLKFNDIDWKQKLIRTTQSKTAVDIWQPMPVEVGNAIYMYIKDARPRGVQSDFVFLTSVPPYKKMNAGSCQYALSRALPRREIRKSGFHTLRRTFATNLLKGGVRPNDIVDVIGQSTPTTVHRYLNLDDSRMMSCPLSLKKYDIPME